ncbi:hypothetical protein [Lentilactobacillus buchneri]|uniref:hypothetical protein n=1 Tax=Lentilactobacillus buchneri TaxID=1581 RepID=UPI0012923467|nr:hypothetical protein [Lentilactobacillus buchneri]MQM76712.1 hypothetical protein [Lentilactobacillus buchneri]MQM86735.1 hypothetical protein [Lentilactobacillus buchneri]MQN21210.1 hypothetical protein [Lentilactobacillus buchneri]
MNEKEKAQNAKRATIMWIMLSLMVLIVIAGIVGIIMKSHQTNQYKDMIRQSIVAYNKTDPETTLSPTSKTKVYRVRKSGDGQFFVQLNGTSPKFVYQKTKGKWSSVGTQKKANIVLKYRAVYTSSQPSMGS